MLVSMCMYTNSYPKCGHSQGHKHICAPNMGSYIKASVMEYIYTCEHMYVCKEVLSASTRKGTDICEFAQPGFTYKGIFAMIYVYL